MSTKHFHYKNYRNWGFYTYILLLFIFDRGTIKCRRFAHFPWRMAFTLSIDLSVNLSFFFLIRVLSEGDRVKHFIIIFDFLSTDRHQHSSLHSKQYLLIQCWMRRLRRHSQLRLQAIISLVIATYLHFHI